MEDLKDIIRELKSYKTSLGLQADDNMILDCSTRIFNAQHINGKKSKQHTQERPATEKQIWRLKKMNVEIPKDLTSREASKLIEENKK